MLSIGSNVGDRLAHLQTVLDGLGDTVLGCSSVYSTAPWGGVQQQDFLNAVLVVEDPGRDASAWLRAGRALESAAERERPVRWGPRTLDVDVLDCDGAVQHDPELVLPHPRAHERAFVLVPWLEVDPAAVVAGRGGAAELLAHLDAAERAGVHRTGLRLVRR